MSEQDNPGAQPDDGMDEIHFLLQTSARILCKSSDPAAFLDWIAEAGPALAPNFAAQVDPRTGPIGHAFRAFGVPIYNAMPLPDADFRPRPLAKPGRNDPCSCGSGAKFKQCCQPLGGVMRFDQVNLLRFVLEVMPKKRYADLPGSRVDPQAVSHTAMEWSDEGEFEDAVALLEPWFAPGRKLHAKLEPLFDQLMECYLQLGRERKRQALLEKLEASDVRELRAAALQRRATILADKGQYDEAWVVFREAQRVDPDNPGIGLLEVTLLVSRGDTQQARERARFWAARLERTRDPQCAPMLQFMRQIVADPAAAFAEASVERNPDIGRLMQLFASAPAPEAHYRVEYADGMGALAGDDAIAKVGVQWRDVYPQVKPMLTTVQLDTDEMWDEAPAWLDFLERTPLAWHSFDVLDDLAMAVDAVAELGLDTALLDPLLARGSALLGANVGEGKLQGTLPWVVGQNRPALRLLAHQAFRALHAAEHDPALSDRFVASAQRLLELNPNDNHGLRGPLSRVYLECGEADKALQLAAAYPDDGMVEMELNHVLALYVLGRRGEALSALAGLPRRRATAVNMLLASNPKAPRASPHGMEVGGKEEAWVYRSEHHALWLRDGALEWLRDAWRAARK